MAVVALALGLIVAALGALGVASPSRFLGVVRWFRAPSGLYLAAALRVVYGVALFRAAAASRAPELVRIVGVAVALTGFVEPFLGIERFRRVLDWWSARGSAFVRTWAVLLLAFGLWLAWVVVP